MNIDCHVHISADTPAHGSLSPRLMNSVAFRFMRWRLGLRGADAQTEEDLNSKLDRIIADTPRLDAAVILAFDAVHDAQGNRDDANTHLYVTNDYVFEVSRRYPRMLPGASVHPYRKDAAAEVERCCRLGAVLLKWLPVTQNFNPADERCFPVYDVLAHYGVPLLSHTGGELSLPTLDAGTADPGLLEPALKRGVRVIAAHCGTRSHPGAPDFVPAFVRLAKEYEHLYGDTSALNLPTRWYAYDTILHDPAVRAKLVHGSDWPILPMPPARLVGLRDSFELMRDTNWMRRDVRIKEQLGFDEAYWVRAAKVLRIGDAAFARAAQARPSLGPLDSPGHG